MDDPLIPMLMDDHDDPIQMSLSGNLLHHQNFVQEYLENMTFQSTNQN